MNIIVINASSATNGHTDVAVKTYLKVFKNKANIKHYDLRNLNYSGCIDCKSCYKTGECIFKDDITELYHDYDIADIVIVATPIYFLSVSSQLKAVIDRTQAIWSSKYKLNKSIIDKNKKRFAVFIATAGADLASNANLGARAVINMYFKAINAKYTDEIIIYNTDNLALNKNNTEQLNLVNKSEQMFKIISKIM